ncbi:UNVERIFIED_CONTAM: hypothetical protein K2H54_015177 [Gekko kuhli]
MTASRERFYYKKALTYELALKEVLRVEAPIFLFANCDWVLRVTRHAAPTLFTAAIPLTPPISEMTNQNHPMMESTEWEPTRSCTILKKAHEEEYVLAAAVHMLVETVSSTWLSVVLVGRWATLLRSATHRRVMLPLECSLIRRDLPKCGLQLFNFQRNRVPVVGIALVQGKYKKFHGCLNLLIVEGRRTSLIRLDQFAALSIDIIGIDHTS